MEPLRLKLVVGHRRPEFPLWPDWQFVTPAPEQGTDFRLTEGRLRPHGPDDQLIGEYFFLFALARQLRTAAPGGLVTFAQYRRLVANASIGMPSPNHPWTRVIDRGTAASLDATTLTAPRAKGFLVSSGMPVPSVLLQFAVHHPARDLARFLSDAVDAGVLDDREATNVLTLKYLIPAPSTGTFPLATFIDTCRILERATYAFVEGGYRPRDDYHRRIIGFCLERLNSYLVLRELTRLGIDLKDATGQQLTIADDALIQATV